MAANVAQIQGQGARPSLYVGASFGALWSLILALAAGSCGGGGAADGGARPDGRDSGAADKIDPRTALCERYQDGDASSPPFEIVQKIFDDNCIACHTQGAALDLSAGVSFAAIVNHAVPAAESCGGTLIVPGNASASYLYQKLTSSHPCAGAQMPLDEIFISQPLPDCVTAILRAWIETGAAGPSGPLSDAAASGG